MGAGQGGMKAFAVLAAACVVIALLVPLLEGAEADVANLGDDAESEIAGKEVEANLLDGWSNSRPWGKRILPMEEEVLAQTGSSERCYGKTCSGYDSGTVEGTRRRRTFPPCTKKYAHTAHSWGSQYCSGPKVHEWHVVLERRAKQKWKREETKIKREVEIKTKEIARKQREIDRKNRANEGRVKRMPKPIPIPAG